jgi:cation diffusion facilitator CzcD-associated flavoprotein CzcO
MINKADMNIAIIGAGPLGIAAGRELLQQGFTRFTVFEKEDAAGGTWHMQTYPGLACDVWAHSYNYSFAPNPDWSAAFVFQPEIEAYLQKCARDFGVQPHIRFNTRVLSAELQANKQWQLTLSDGTVVNFDAVINAMGNQHTPVIPEIPGSGTFAGPSWHSANYNHAVDLRGKRVTVIGSAAAAIQIVPEVAKVAGQLTVLQRSPNWIVPRNNKPYSAFTRKMFQRFPFTLRCLQSVQNVLMGFVHKAFLLDDNRRALFEKMGRAFIEKSIKDPAVRKLVQPDSLYGCKRPLVSDDFYPALNRENVRLVASAAASITPDAVITASGEHIASDVIIYCTGYRVMDFDRIRVIGKEGKSLADDMAQAPFAYKGILVPGYPNYFLGMGPNAVVLSVSYFRSVELNVACIVNLLSEMCANDVQAVDVKPDLHRRYNDWIVEHCRQFAWGSGTCHNYYMNDAGHTPFLYPGDFRSFVKMRADCGLEQFIAFPA